MVLVPVAEATGRGHIDVARAAESVGLVDEAMAIPGVEAVTHAAQAISPEDDPGCPFGFGVVRSTTSHAFGVPVAGRRTGRRTRSTRRAPACSGCGWGASCACAPFAEHLSAWLATGVCRRRPGDPAPGDRHHPRRREVTDTAEPGVAVGPGFYDRYAGEVAGCACTIWVRADADRLDDVRPGLEALYGPYGFTLRPDEQINTRRRDHRPGGRRSTHRGAVGGHCRVVLIQVLSRQATAMAADHDVRRAPR